MTVTRLHPPGSSVYYCPLCGDVIHVDDPDEGFEDAIKRFMVRPILLDDAVRASLEASYARAEAEAAHHFEVRHTWRWRAFRALGWAWLIGGLR